MTYQQVIGIMGVGHLIRHMVPGLLRAAVPPKLLLSPRGAETAGALSRRFGIEIAKDNHDLVESSQMVLIAVRPFQLAQAMTGLPWRDDHLVVSLVAGISIDTVQALVPRCRVARAIPVIAGEFGASPTCVFPDVPDVRRLLEPTGPIVPLAVESDFEAASIISCYCGWVQALMGEVTAWLQTENIDPDVARHLVAAMTKASGTVVLERRDEPLDRLVSELCLPGSFTGQGLDLLRDRKAFAPWREACQALLERMHKQRGS